MFRQTLGTEGHGQVFANTKTGMRFEVCREVMRGSRRHGRTEQDRLTGMKMREEGTHHGLHIGQIRFDVRHQRRSHSDEDMVCLGHPGDLVGEKGVGAAQKLLATRFFERHNPVPQTLDQGDVAIDPDNPESEGLEIECQRDPDTTCSDDGNFFHRILLNLVHPEPHNGP